MVDLPSPERSGALSRRAVLAAGVAGVAGLALAGCSTDEPASDKASPRATAALAPDVAVATSALADIRAVQGAVAATGKRYPAARPQLADLGRMHRVHEAALVDAVPDRAKPSATPAPYVVPRRREAALRALATREQQLHTSLDGLALRAQSGDFARLLASMGAAIDQRLAVWPG